jgi:cytochrome oxidase Cu insertion factor (SCO1/SenC/PrrC family)
MERIVLAWLAAAAALAMSFSPANAGDKVNDPVVESGPPEPKVAVGDLAPDFTLLDQNGTPVTLSSFRGEKKVVLAFYIFAFSGG